MNNKLGNNLLFFLYVCTKPFLWIKYEGQLCFVPNSVSPLLAGVAFKAHPPHSGNKENGKLNHRVSIGVVNVFKWRKICTMAYSFSGLPQPGLCNDGLHRKNNSSLICDCLKDHQPYTNESASASPCQA